ncbi:hypothetical protein N8988_00615 [Opitutales bacterium]|nr:hypothetical protein [Opitutales bacterium]
MKIKHLEKYILLLSFVVLIVLFTLFTNVSPQSSSVVSSNQIFSLKTKNGKTYFSLNRETSLIPGDFIYLSQDEESDWSSYEIKSILLLARQKIQFSTSSGIVRGTTRQDVILEKNWKKSHGIIALRDGNKVFNIQYNDISRITGTLWLSTDIDSKTIKNNQTQVSFYQRTLPDEPIITEIDKLKWTNPVSDENSTPYDLFTPPIIYIHNGDLTTRLPEKEVKTEKLEPFGLTLTKVSKSEYPLILKSWVGETPYFEDLMANGSSNLGKVVRNRVELGKAYKRDLSRKPGQPSLIQCDDNDSQKMFIVQHFVVQQYRNPQTGGLRPVGRAMIKDFQLGGSAFEINTLMTKVFAGNYTFHFLANLPNLSPQEFSFESTSVDSTFDYGGRVYRISSANYEDSSLVVTKEDPRQAEIFTKTFSF